MAADDDIPNLERSILDLNHYIPYYIRATANKLARAASSSYSSQFGVGLGEWSCLALLAMEGDVSATRISEVSGFDKAAVSRSINSLETKGLVATRPVKEHNRKRLIQLTKAGRDVHRQIAHIALARQEKLLRGITVTERALLLRLVRILDKNAALILTDIGETAR